jgi:AraC-like DNA-binding protein
VNYPEPDFFSKQVGRARRFYFNLDPPEPLGIHVVSAGCETCLPHYRIARDTFPFFTIEFLAAGEGELCLDGITSVIHPGAVFTYGPGIPHSICNIDNTPLVKYFVNFSGETVERLIKEGILSIGEFYPFSSSKAMHNKFEELLDQGLSGTPYSGRLCGAIAETLIYMTAEASMLGLEAGNPALARYRECRNIITGNYMRIKTLKDAAAACGIDPAYLCRLYKRFDSQTPYQHILRLQMTHAAGRLLTPEKLVKEVADEMGYNDPFHFSRTFKRVFGVSPNRFVNEHRR